MSAQSHGGPQPNHHLRNIRSLLQGPTTSTSIERLRRRNLSAVLNRILDRSNVLEGHTGCVNALSWAQDGNLLISGGDDTTIRLWSIDSCQTEQEYPFVCSAVIATGHRSNIFSAKMLPHSSRIATAAKDREIRVFDAKTALDTSSLGKGTLHSFDQTRGAIIRCHSDSVKRIVTEDSPDLFLSASEDGSVRQHDLRTPHNCLSGSCPAPVIDLGHELSTLSLSPLTPHELVVAGEAPYGYLFDRRHLRKTIEANWGAISNAGQGATTCVRRFGRPSLPSNRRDIITRITGARISKSNGHEVILSFSGDAVYLYSTRDDPEDTDMSTARSSGLSREAADEADILNASPGTNVPIVMPRNRYAGARNVATIKDVNFLGPDDEYIVSGSDDGNFFIWNKTDGDLHGIYEGDGSVVNIIEGHPHFPLIAISGIDTTVKLFSPASSASSFSRVDNAQQIIETNQRIDSTRVMRADHLAALRILANLRSAADNEESTPNLECRQQ